MVYYLAQFGGGLSNLVQNLLNLEFFQLLFPFLLGMTIVYVLIQWAAGDRIGNAPNAMISIIVGFFVMLYFSWNPTLYATLTTMSGVLLMVASAILFFIILLALVGVKIEELGKEEEGKGLKVILILIIAFIVIVIVFGATPFGIPYWLTGSDFWTILFFIVIIAIVLYFLGKKPSEGKKKEGEPPS